MTMISFLHLVHLVAILCILTCDCWAYYSPRKPPHVLFVLADDIGWGDVGFNLGVANHEVSPNTLHGRLGTKSRHSLATTLRAHDLYWNTNRDTIGSVASSCANILEESRRPR